MNNDTQPPSHVAIDDDDQALTELVLVRMEDKEQAIEVNLEEL